MKNILACIDTSSYANDVCDLTIWTATRLKARVELLHVVKRTDAIAARKDLSGAIGLGVKSELLEELTRIDETESRRAIQQGRVVLADAEARLKVAGITRVNRLHRHGDVVETIIERELDADLVIIGKHGDASERLPDTIGSKIESVVRSSIKPVLIAPKKIQTPENVVIALDGSSAAGKAVDFVVSSPLFTGMQVHLVAAGPKGTVDSSWFVKAYSKLVDRSPSCIIHIVDGSPRKVVGDYVRQHPGVILVMGAYGHSPLRTMIFGSTTSAMIREAKVPVLLLR